MHYHWGQRTEKKRNVTNWSSAHKMKKKKKTTKKQKKNKQTKKSSATLTAVSWNNNRAL